VDRVIATGQAWGSSASLPRYALLSECGHFSYLERPEEFHREVVDFFTTTPSALLAGI